MSILHLHLLLCVFLLPCHGSGETSSTISDSKFAHLPRLEGDTKEPMGISANRDMKSVKEFSYNEIENATDNFSDEKVIGTGGNGKVYKGTLDGTKVVVKCPIGGDDLRTHSSHILNEIDKHSQVKDPSIVQLLGYGCTLIGPCLVYEYLSKGNLFHHIHSHHNHTFLTWQQRLSIVHQVAKALAYLHNHRIFHVDVKSANILLAENLNAKLTDFGHSQIVEPKKCHISMPAEGTPSLIDPYWRKTGQLTDKTDVYGFGILLVELLTSQKAVDLERDKDGAIVVEKEKLMKSIDPSLKASKSQVVLEQMMALGSLAVNCMNRHIKNRPTMKEVAEEIKCIMKLDSCPSHLL